MKGIVIEGLRGASGLGFPTANIKVNPKDSHPSGVYAGLVEVLDGFHTGTYLATIHIDDNFEHEAEAHLLNFSGDLYGSTISILIKDRIRDCKFPCKSKQEFKDRLLLDCKQVKAILNK
jgi:riboflavin kinase / FMN adenylyltransferase